MYSLKKLEEFKKQYNSLSLPYEEKTDQNKTIIIYITKDINNEYHIVFRYTECKNPNYGHSYYLETIYERDNNSGLCLNTNEYESLNAEKMECVNAYIEGFLIFIKDTNLLYKGIKK
tara:strand:+ start:51 stop:401 length:351 start_codon:yes stop_codon:yes gene_type:complete